jgi:hypothetical protein
MTKNGGKKGNRVAQKPRRAAKVVGLTTTPSIFPPMFRGKMFYNTIIGLTPGAGAAVANVFRLNSVYDPDFTGVGTSAVGYTQLAALYGRYRVLSAKISVEFINTTAAVPLTCFLVVNPVTTVGVGIAQILAQRFVWTRGVSAITGSATVFHTAAADVHTIYGVPRTQVRNEDDFAAVAGANPNNGVYAHVGVYANGAASTANAHVRIEFDVVWTLPLELSP